mmetsp:Transcript_1792/g.2494  ORF Transcript_1792/g.2494 Transcript_1792/m.2494 type:complete len:293 (+) Transcript_1792:1551-2429(+)
MRERGLAVRSASTSSVSITTLRQASLSPMDWSPPGWSACAAARRNLCATARTGGIRSLKVRPCWSSERYAMSVAQHLRHALCTLGEASPVSTVKNICFSSPKWGPSLSPTTSVSCSSMTKAISRCAGSWLAAHWPTKGSSSGQPLPLVAAFFFAPRPFFVVSRIVASDAITPAIAVLQADTVSASMAWSRACWMPCCTAGSQSRAAQWATTRRRSRDAASCRTGTWVEPTTSSRRAGTHWGFLQYCLIAASACLICAVSGTNTVRSMASRLGSLIVSSLDFFLLVDALKISL